MSVETGKQQAIKGCGNDFLIRFVKQDWSDIAELLMKSVREFEEVVENLRTKALQKTREEWQIFSQSSTRLWGIFLTSTKRGNTTEIKELIAFILKFIRDNNNAIPHLIASRQ